MARIVVQRGRTNKIQINVGFDASADSFASQIRAEKDQAAELIADWVITKPNDNGLDGLLELTLDNSVIDEIEHGSGWMDIKRVSGGEPLPVFSEPIEVIFRGTVTA